MDSFRLQLGGCLCKGLADDIRTGRMPDNRCHLGRIPESGAVRAAETLQGPHSGRQERRKGP